MTRRDRIVVLGVVAIVVATRVVVHTQRRTTRTAADDADACVAAVPPGKDGWLLLGTVPSWREAVSDRWTKPIPAWHPVGGGRRCLLTREHRCAAALDGAIFPLDSWRYPQPGSQSIRERMSFAHLRMWVKEKAHSYEISRWRAARQAAAAAAAARGKPPPLWFGRATETIESAFRPMGVPEIVRLFNFTYPRSGTAATRDFSHTEFVRGARRAPWNESLVRPLPALLRHKRVGGLVRQPRFAEYFVRRKRVSVRSYGEVVVFRACLSGCVHG